MNSSVTDTILDYTVHIKTNREFLYIIENVCYRKYACVRIRLNAHEYLENFGYHLRFWSPVE